MTKIPIEVLPGERLPTKAHSTDVGWDCYYSGAPIEIVLGPENGTATIKVPLGFKVDLPAGVELQVRGRSGLASKSIFTHFGTVDPGYKGEVCVVLQGAWVKSFALNLKPGDKVCQVVPKYVPQISFSQVFKLNSLNDRGGGFGSTGI